MSYEIPGLLVPFVAETAFPKQMIFGKLNTNGNIEPAGDGDLIDMVVQNQPDAGTAGTCMMSGISMVTAAGPINPGDLVQSDANGEAVVMAGGARAGKALDQATLAGEVVAVFISPALA